MNFLLLIAILYFAAIILLLLDLSVMLRKATDILKEIEYVLKAQESIEDYRTRTTMQTNKMLEKK